MDVLRRARRLESRIAATLDGAARVFSRSRTRGPLEIVHAILDAVEQQIEPTGRGSRVFPFNRLELSVVASSPEALPGAASQLTDVQAARGRHRGR